MSHAILSRRRQPNSRFPSLLASAAERSDVRLRVAQTLETVTLARTDNADAAVAVIGIESWVSRVGWTNLCVGPVAGSLAETLVGAVEFADNDLGIRQLLAFAIDEREVAVARSHSCAELLGDLDIIGRPSLTLIRFTPLDADAPVDR